MGKSENNVTLFTRPRRFGKTLTMSCYGLAFYRKQAMVRLGATDVTTGILSDSRDLLYIGAMSASLTESIDPAMLSRI